MNGPGKELAAVQEWRGAFPLVPGARLDQPVWEGQKRSILSILEEQGYLSAAFSTQEIRLDLDTNQADLALILETGSKAVMGEVVFKQDLLREYVLRPIPRFKPGDPYHASKVETLKTDLWRTGYWAVIDITEDRQLDMDPQTVNLQVTLEPTEPNTHQGTIGFGTDTEFRTQYRFQRYYLSERGDALSAGFGWQSRNEELLLFSEYRLPRQVPTNQYWQLVPVLKRQHQDIDVSFAGETEVFRLASGRIDDSTVRFGRVRLHNLGDSREQLIETIYAQYLREDDNFKLVPEYFDTLTTSPENGETEDVFGVSRYSISLGMEWDWPVVQGAGFGLRGHRERAWIFTSNEAWGSEVDFSQVYLSTRWEIPIGERSKLLLRGEAGYSDARVNEVELEIDGRPLRLSITELPFLYRFKAGGSQSVRGYDYEALSDNSIGSNHVLTASVEYEYMFKQDWSLAAFFDVGNAFNDWSEPKLKRGVGAGLRWYSRIGALRLDLAQAQDIPGHPWRVHLTIGTPLL